MDCGVVPARLSLKASAIPFEGRQLLAVRIFGMILLEQFSATRAFACQAGYIPGKQGFPFNLSGGRFPMTGLRTTEDSTRLVIGKREAA